MSGSGSDTAVVVTGRNHFGQEYGREAERTGGLEAEGGREDNIDMVAVERQSRGETRRSLVTLNIRSN